MDSNCRPIELVCFSLSTWLGESICSPGTAASVTRMQHPHHHSSRPVYPGLMAVVRNVRRFKSSAVGVVCLDVPNVNDGPRVSTTGRVCWFLAAITAADSAECVRGNLCFTSRLRAERLWSACSAKSAAACIGEAEAFGSRVSYELVRHVARTHMVFVPGGYRGAWSTLTDGNDDNVGAGASCMLALALVCDV